MQHRARIVVVILNWNGLAWLQHFLPGVVAHSTGARIVVADNASTDGSVEWLRTHLPEVEVQLLASNKGYAGGYNQALSSVHEELAVLLNSDVEVRPGWLAALSAYMDEDPGMAACQPKVLSHATPSRFEHAGAAGGFLDHDGYPFCRGRIFELTEDDRGQYDDARQVFWATGACLLIRMVAWREAGGFDESLFAHMEEIDLCWRLRRKGWRIGYTPTAVVLHVGGGALAYSDPRKTYLNFRNSLIVLTRNITGPYWPLALLRRLVLDGLAAWKFLLEGNAAHFVQVIRAHWHYVCRLPKLIRQRRELLEHEANPDLTGLYLRSIALDRYLWGRRRFTDLPSDAFVNAGASGPQPAGSHPAPDR
ncbi:MAG: glycosyltransferase family 2 protein [Flavobacteriales bacterium]|nr:glycosyltransferase family 2 protein [Flavobacteriales bacterium]